jgi:hypothetical protein
MTTKGATYEELERYVEAFADRRLILLVLLLDPGAQEIESNLREVFE